MRATVYINATSTVTEASLRQGPSFCAEGFCLGPHARRMAGSGQKWQEGSGVVLMLEPGATVNEIARRSAANAYHKPRKQRKNPVAIGSGERFREGKWRRGLLMRPTLSTR